MNLGRVTFQNATGQPVSIYVVDPTTQQVPAVDLNPGATSAQLTGRLLNIDVTRGGALYSYDLIGYLPNGLLVEDESPYRLTQVLATDHQTLVLGIYDNEGQLVGEFDPAAVLQGVAGAAAPLAAGGDAAVRGEALPAASADAPQSVLRAGSFFAAQRLAPSVFQARLSKQDAAPSSPQTVFTTSSSGLLSILLTEQAVSPAVEAELAVRRQQMFDLTGVASAYVRGQASEQKNPNLVYDTMIWQEVFNNLPLMGPSEFVRQQFSQHLRGVEIAGKFLQTILGYAVAAGPVLTQFSSFLQGLGEQIRLGTESGTKSFSVGAISIVLEQQRGDILGILKGYFLDFSQSQRRIYSNCATAQTFDVSFDYRVATSIFNAGALQNPDVKREFDGFISGTQLDDVKKARNFFKGTVPPRPGA